MGHREWDERTAKRQAVLLLSAMFAWAVALGIFVFHSIFLIVFPNTHLIETIMGMFTGLALFVGTSTRLWEIANVET